MVKRKILLVEDNEAIATMVKTRLEANNYETIIALDGEDGIEKARKENPDLIILDLILPKLDGYGVCCMLKADAQCSKIPVIMFTARAQDVYKKMGQEAGADAYITKPFEPQALLLKIKELLGEE